MSTRFLDEGPPCQKGFAMSNLYHHVGAIIPISKEELQEFQDEVFYPFVQRWNKLLYVFQKEKKAYCHILSPYFKVEAIVLRLDTDSFYDRLLIQTSAGNKMVLVEKSKFSTSSLSELADLGLPVDCKASTLFLKYVAMQEEMAPTITEYSEVGWKCLEGELSFLGYAMSNNYVYIGEKDILPKGSPMDFYELDGLVKGSVGLSVALATSLSSVLIGLFLQKGFSIEPLLVHFYGSSSCGKTSALELAASVWGSPVPGKGLLNSWNSTDNALLARLNNNFGVAMCFDESSVMKRDFTTLIYCISQGRDKDRLTKAAELHNPRRFGTSILSSGENSLLSNSNPNIGLRVRVLELFNPPLTESAKHSNQIKKFVLSHHATLGPAFVSGISTYSVEVLWEMVQTQKSLFESAVKEMLMPVTERLSMKYALLLTTANLVNEILHFHLSTQNMLAFFADHHNSYFDEVNLGNRAYQVLLEWTTRNRGKLQENCGQSTGISYEGILTKETVILLEGTFEKILKDAGFTDIKTVAHELRNMKILLPEKRNGLKARIVVNGIRNSCYRIKLHSDCVSLQNDLDDLTTINHEIADEELRF